MITCSVDGCTKVHYGNGYCRLHYDRVRRTGSVNGIRIGHRFEEQDAASRIAERSVRVGKCLIYTWGHEQRSGHAAIGYHGRLVGVHRVAWALANGRFPADGEVVRHTCDTPRCVEPTHLLIGTVADNNRDRDERGRHVALLGEDNGFAKLTADDVRQIRAMLGGESQRAIAETFSVSQTTVWAIANGRTWSHLKDDRKREGN